MPSAPHSKQGGRIPLSYRAVIIYFVIAGLVLAMSFFSDLSLRLGSLRTVQNQVFLQRRSRHWTPFDLLAVGVLVIFSAIRYEVGSDYGTYSSLYAALDPSRWRQQLTSSPQGVGYTGMSLIIKALWGPSTGALFWITSILTVVPIYVVIKRRSQRPTLSLLLYIFLAFYIDPFNIIREGIAASLTFFASNYINTSKRNFLLLNGLAAIIHKTAIVAATIQIVFRRTRPSMRLLIVLALAGALGAVVLLHSAAIASLVSTLNPRYGPYLRYSTQTKVGAYILTISRVVLILYALNLRRRGASNSETDRDLTYGIVGVMFLVLGTQAIIVARMEMYFGLYLILAIPNLLANREARLREHDVESALIRILLSAAGILYLSIYLNNYGGLIPYHARA